ncbi:MAG: hypothetical protein PHU27_00740 [Salinivirgaceae bacterium]|nr:hypothetical protein [Salinivirgaceae bacterium]MDD4746357.1 hypothetical protein [Salinivirgaceae bacterium]MDY0280121.1 hypothetical protein [Salinivirgaceae bacterium]
MVIKASDCFLLGSISKTHGVNGSVVIQTEHNLELAEFEEPIFVVIDELPVPLFLEEITEKNSGAYIVKFELINTPEVAKEFVGCKVLAPRTIIDQNNLNLLTQIKDIQVSDIHYGIIGTCTAIEPIPGNPLMIIDTPKGQIFIPIAEEWIVEFIPNKSITLNCPEGLLNIEQ